jgi:hypothetical protein
MQLIREQNIRTHLDINYLKETGIVLDNGCKQLRWLLWINSIIETMVIKGIEWKSIIIQNTICS